jgi:hypothetical protein
MFSGDGPVPDDDVVFGTNEAATEVGDEDDDSKAGVIPFLLIVWGQLYNVVLDNSLTLLLIVLLSLWLVRLE